MEREAFEGAAIAVETVIEDLAVKQAVLSRVEQWLPHEAVLATNTSSLSLSTLAEALARPARFAGLHFLHPAHATGIVEVVPGRATDERTLETVATVARQIGKKPLVLHKEIPGFVWNRLQFAVLRECLHLLDEGVADIDAIDTAISDGLAPRWLSGGPFASADLGGLRTFSLASRQLLPLLAATQDVSHALTSRADADGSFYQWTPEQRERIEALRDEAVAIGEHFAERRRATMPSQDEG
jgi:3-hydroxybutyryl-CoA dehydrogenase